MNVVEGERPVQLNWRDSQQLMAALHSGKRLVFARSAWYGEDTPVRIMVEPVRFRSALDDLPGVGPKRKKALIREFGSVKRIREASVEQLASVEGIGPALAEQIKATL